MTSDTAISIRIEPSIAAIDAAGWDACANPPADGQEYNPFVSHAFLAALEESDCVTPRTGWAPRHLVVEDGAGGLLGAVPAYLKAHSQGEYVFDHGWADAYERAGGDYYPKVQVSVPFSPVAGPRLLVRPDAQSEALRTALATGMVELARRSGASSVHVTFQREAEWRLLTQLGFLARTDQQFHWIDRGYSDFEDFLGGLASRKRKALKRERREALADGIEIDWITGSDLTEAHWDAFHAFYMDTGARKWGRPYLNRRFFSLIGERMADDVLLVMARRAGRYIAGALNLIGGDTLYGRNWGSVEHHPFLHFEVCYYQAIDFALARGLRFVEAGAQGEHKLTRGYEPRLTYSSHWIADPGLRRAVADYLRRERRHVDALQPLLSELTPFRRG